MDDYFGYHIRDLRVFETWAYSNNKYSMYWNNGIFRYSWDYDIVDQDVRDGDGTGDWSLHNKEPELMFHELYRWR